MIFVQAVPDVGQVLVFCKEKLVKSYEVVKALIERNDAIRVNIPTLFLPMMRPQLIKMENAFMPGFSTITWTSMKIAEFCEDVTNVLNYIEMFVKEVRDMKEARIDEVLDTLSTTTLVYLPPDAILPSEFLSLNEDHRIKIGMKLYLCNYADVIWVTLISAKEIELKSSTIENCVIELINKFLSVIDQPELQENKYNWLDPVKAVKPIGSTSRLLMSADAGNVIKLSFLLHSTKTKFHENNKMQKRLKPFLYNF